MGFLSVLSYAHKLVAERLQPGDAAIDATAGTGADTLFLARTSGRRGQVWAFDIQAEALRLTQARLDLESRDQLAHVTLLQRSHAEMREQLPEAVHGQIGAVMFNLGYLPTEEADQSLITLPESTIAALETAVSLLRPRGIATVVLYPGHSGGDQEAEAVHAWAANLPSSIGQTVLYRQIQRPHAPYLIAIEKK
ncbi:class I SAM-dependent methyltransferase [Paenibacillus sp. D2_2]|uniref:tRNA (mnm(5)s(2)U34)-methyltransferase n=1 Tax=Paenibacillus sp. D2_2 TaxID=3073092 RepID=UPI00281662FC|nr:class I SAM-dependent methyltransferase [Paenibacillus sp. D2_2]WMT39841.1 class I SAM-dependent methyltransferase [Paenibacillus sp. D2_2]